MSPGMCKIKRLAVVLCGALAFSGLVAVPTAMAALPEFYKGANPIAAGAVINFTSASEAAPEIKFPITTNMTCTSAADEGQTNGPKEVRNVFVHLKGCKKGLLGCKTPERGVANEEVVTHALRGVLVYLKKAAPTEVGMVYSPRLGGAAGVVTTYKCTGFPTQSIVGTVIGEVRPLNAEGREWKAIFEEMGGMQKFEKYENEVVAMPHHLVGCTGALVLLDKEKITWEGMTEVKIMA